MESVLYFDYCAFLVLLLLIFSSFQRRMTKGKVNMVFLATVFLCLFTTAADISSVMSDRRFAGNLVVQYTAHTLYLFLHNLLPIFYVYYILTFSDFVNELRGIKRLAFFVPVIISGIFILLSPFGKGVFYIDAEGLYHRSPMMLIMYLTACFYIIFSVVHILKYRDIFGAAQVIALVHMNIIVVTALVIQMIFPHYLVEMFFTALGLLMVSVTVHRPEEYIDTDTGLGKREAYTTLMRNSLMYNKHKIVIMLNIRNIMALRDMLGYMLSVKLLKRIAHRLEKVCREVGVHGEMYYLGVGKFRVVIDSRYEEQAEKAAERINSVMKIPLVIHEMDILLNSVVCITRCPEDINEVESLLTFGDDINNKDSQGKVLRASEVYQKKRYDILRHIDSIIENALTNHKFEVYYQPIYSVREKRFNSAEALLRLRDEEYGFISPEFFIPAAEKSGAIHRIGAYVLEQVCEFINSDEFKRLGIEYIEVNLSVTQCLRSDLADEVSDIIKKYGVTSDQINLEITETAASNSQSIMMDNISALSDKGISFSLDDFGTGYSNMSRIATMPFKLIKLDKSFVNLERNDKLLIVLKSTIRMIKDMGMKIVVEGIETEDMVQKFSDLECEYIQGYYYSKPICRRDFVKFIEKQNAG